MVLYKYRGETPQKMKGRVIMNNVVMFLMNRYERLAYTNKYIFGFRLNGLVYAYYTQSLTVGMVADTASKKNGGQKSLRYCPKKAEKQALIESGMATPICTETYFDSMVENSRYNKGEIFEKIITEKCGQKWEKDNKKFTECGDIVVKNVHYQIKFEKATFTNETTLDRLERQ